MEEASGNFEGADGALRTGPQVDDDYLTVTMLSAGLAEILDRRSHAGQHAGRSDGLLPAAWRGGFARLWWRCQDQGIPSLDSDLDLLALCTRPFAAWPVSLVLSSQDLQSCLLVGEELSAFAEQGARTAVSDVEAEWRENRVYHALRTGAAANGVDDDKEVERAYAALRRLLIDCPVLSDLDLRWWEREFPRSDASGQTYLRRLIDEAYVSRTLPGIHEYLRCPDCGNTAPDVRSLCGTAGCMAPPAETVTVRALAWAPGHLPDP